MLETAGYKIKTFVSDRFCLDGGAMFGSVPKVLWGKLIEPDSKNRIPMLCRLLVLTKDKQTILIDAGCGTKWDSKGREMYAIENQYSESLDKVIPNVTDLIFTHFHFDHCGGATKIGASGKSELVYPNAKMYLQSDHLDYIGGNVVRDRASFFPENIEPIKNGNLNLLKGEQEVLPGIKVFPINGHTKGLQWILIGEGDGAVAYVTDLVPTSNHLHLPYIMGYDICAETTLNEKQKFLASAVKHNWTVIFEHDVEIPAGKIGIDEKGRYVIKEIINI